MFPGEDPAAELKECLEITIPNFIAKIEGLLAKNGKKFLLDDKLTQADFWAGSFYVNNITNPNNPYSKDCVAMLEAAPAFKAWGEAFAS